jgi:hypothetical protein
MEELIQFAESLGSVNSSTPHLEFKLHDFQKNLLADLLQQHKNVILAAHQSGISTMLEIFITYQLVNAKLKDKPFNVGILSFKQAEAIDKIKKIHRFLEKLHIAHKATATHIEVINGGSVSLIKEGDIYGGKLQTLNLLSVDDCGYFYEKNLAILNKILETIPKNASVILATTGGGKSVNEIIALKDDPSYNFIKIPWDQIPNRGEAWVEKWKNMLGEEIFKKEFEIDKIIEEYEALKRKNSKN